MKTPEKLNAPKEDVETLNIKFAELTGEELAQVTGGRGGKNYAKDLLDDVPPDSSCD